MRAVTVVYVLRDGRRGRLHCIAPSTSDAVLRAIDLFGIHLRSASARPS